MFIRLIGKISQRTYHKNMEVDTWSSYNNIFPVWTVGEKCDINGLYLISSFLKKCSHFYKRKCQISHHTYTGSNNFHYLRILSAKRKFHSTASSQEPIPCGTDSLQDAPMVTTILTISCLGSVVMNFQNPLLWVISCIRWTTVKTNY